MPTGRGSCRARVLAARTRTPGRFVALRHLSVPAAPARAHDARVRSPGLVWTGWNEEGRRAMMAMRRGTDGAAAPQYGDEAVILVHGFWTPAAVFLPHVHWLGQQGYRVRRFGYPSVRATLSENAQALQRFLATTEVPAIHLVGHSLGRLIILEMLAERADLRLRRVVLLGTPCLGSHCARRLATRAGMPALPGRSIMETLLRARFATIAPRSLRPSRSACWPARAASASVAWCSICHVPTRRGDSGRDPLARYRGLHRAAAGALGDARLAPLRRTDRLFPGERPFSR